MRKRTILQPILSVSGPYAKDTSGRDLARARLACGHSATVSLPEKRKRMKCVMCTSAPGRGNAPGYGNEPPPKGLRWRGRAG